MTLACGILALTFLAVGGLMLLYLLGITIADRAREFEHREAMRHFKRQQKQGWQLPGGGPIS